MDPECSEGNTSSLFLKSTGQYEGDRAMCIEKRELNAREKTPHRESTLGQCPAKRRSTDNQEEVATPKRIKQEIDDSGLYKENLQKIVCEVADSLELGSDSSDLSNSNNEKQNFEKANDRPLDQHDVIVVLDNEDEDELIAENTKETSEPFPHPSDKRREIMAVYSAMNQVNYEPKRPILRTLKDSDSRGSNGFAFDHNFFPKLIEVHSASSSSAATTSVSTEQESSCDLPQISEFYSPFEKQDEDITGSGPVEINKISRADTSAASSRIDSKLLDTRLDSPWRKQHDLLFTFRQKDGQSDMFLVVDGEVFSVRRYEHKGESYLIHTNSSGKTSILARLPERVVAGSQEEAAVTSQSVLGEQRDTTRNGLPSALEQPGNTFLQRGLALNHSRTSPVTITPVLVRKHLSANSVKQRSFQRIPRVTLERECSSKHDMCELPAARVTRNDTSNLGKGQQSQVAERRQRDVGANVAEMVTPDQRRFHPMSGVISQPVRRYVNASDSVQSSTAVHNNVFSTQRDPLSSSSRSRDHQLVFKRKQVGMVERNLPSEQPIAVTTAQRRYSNDMASDRASQGYTYKVSNDESSDKRYHYVALSREDKQRIINRTKLMNYIAQRLASGNEQSSTSVSANRGSEVGNARHAHYRTTVNGSASGRVNASARCQVTPNIYQTDTCSTADDNERHHSGSRNVPSLVRTMGIHNAGQRIPVYQLESKNSGLINTQPRSDAQGRVTNPMYGGLRMNDGARSSNGILETVDSWQGRPQRHISLVRDPSLVNKVLTGITVSVPGIPTPNTTASTVNSSIQNVSRSAPVISQVSYGVISRSMVGENVTPKQSATALVIDPERSIYVDATDSVIDEERFSSILGQRLPRPTVRQTVNASTVNQSHSSDLSDTHSKSSSSFQSSMRQMPEQSSFATPKLDKRCVAQNTLKQSTFSTPKIDKRCVAHNTLDRSTFSTPKVDTRDQSTFSTPKIDKRCVAHNTLKDIFPTTNPPSKRTGVLTQMSGQQNSSYSSRENNSDTDDVVEIMINTSTRQGSQTQPTKVPVDTHGQRRHAVKNLSQSATNDFKPGVYDDDDDDIVEIIYETPKRVPNENAAERNGDSEVVSKERSKSCPQICTAPSDSVEIANPTSNQRSHPPKAIILEEEEDKGKQVPQLQEHTSDSTLKRLLQSYPNGPNRADTPEYKDKGVDEMAEETNSNLKQDSDPSQTDGCDIAEKEKDHLELYMYNKAELKNIQQRDELLKKIKHTEERVAQETIEWKKKYLHRLEVQLKKKLAKLPSVTEFALGKNDDESEEDIT